MSADLSPPPLTHSNQSISLCHTNRPPSPSPAAAALQAYFFPRDAGVAPLFNGAIVPLVDGRLRTLPAAAGPALYMVVSDRWHSGGACEGWAGGGLAATAGREPREIERKGVRG